MERILEIEDRTYKFKNSGALPILYRQLIGGDLLRDLNALNNGDEVPEGLLDIMTGLAYVMARHAKDENTEDIVTWSEQFEFNEMAEKVIPLVAEMWKEGNKTTSKPKK